MMDALQLARLINALNDVDRACMWHIIARLATAGAEKDSGAEG